MKIVSRKMVFAIAAACIFFVLVATYLAVRREETPVEEYVPPATPTAGDIMNHQDVFTGREVEMTVLIEERLAGTFAINGVKVAEYAYLASNSGTQIHVACNQLYDAQAAVFIRGIVRKASLENREYLVIVASESREIEYIPPVG
jgi:hypothetical protein